MSSRVLIIMESLAAQHWLRTLLRLCLACRACYTAGLPLLLRRVDVDAGNLEKVIARFEGERTEGLRFGDGAGARESRFRRSRSASRRRTWLRCSASSCPSSVACNRSSWICRDVGPAASAHRPSTRPNRLPSPSDSGATSPPSQPLSGLRSASCMPPFRGLEAGVWSFVPTIPPCTRAGPSSSAPSKS
ncbi:hypothetical protein DFJ74DRAFT_448426 [Hyaloraphidium curvatum]|nr:hypothetical protein DFJ74DRAFT_448426 [Hyaloraphidium curvatum]